MKKYMTASMLALSLMMTHHAQADSALGVVLGDPTGFSGRTSLDGQHSLEGALAYSTGHHSGLHVHGTYLWDRARVFSVERSGPIEMYYGLGLRLISINSGKHDGDIAIGPRAPLGVVYKINNPNLEFFGELSLALDVAPDTDVDLDAGVGIRIRF